MAAKNAPRLGVQVEPTRDPTALMSSLRRSSRSFSYQRRKGTCGRRPVRSPSRGSCCTNRRRRNRSGRCSSVYARLNKWRPSHSHYASEPPNPLSTCPCRSRRTRAWRSLTPLFLNYTGRSGYGSSTSSLGKPRLRKSRPSMRERRRRYLWRGSSFGTYKTRPYRCTNSSRDARTGSNLRRSLCPCNASSGFFCTCALVSYATRPFKSGTTTRRLRFARSSTSCG